MDYPLSWYEVLIIFVIVLYCSTLLQKLQQMNDTLNSIRDLLEDIEDGGESARQSYVGIAGKDD